MNTKTNVLILEDNPSDAELIQRELRKAGLDVAARVAPDREGFLRALDQFAADILLADYSVPGFDGLSAVALARQRFPDVPAVVVSGTIGEEFAIETLKAGANDYVLKDRLSRLGPVVLRALKEAEQLVARRRAEQALRESQDRQKVAEAVQAERQRFRAVLDMLPAYLVLLSPDYRVPYANRFFEERFGKSFGKRCFEYLFQRSEPCENCETYKVLKTGAPHRWEWTGPDGRNYDIYDFPFTDVDGSPLIMEVGLDVTERKRAEVELEKHRHHLEELVRERTAQLEEANAHLQAEIAERERAGEALRQSREDLDRAQAVGQIGSWRLDVRRNVLTWSDENHRMFGVPKGTPLTYERFLEIVHPDDRECVDAQWKAGLRGEPYDIEHRIVVDGRVKWVREKAYLECDEAGKLLGGFGIAQDITERKQGEEALRRLAQFPEQNPNPVLRIAEDGGLMYANAPARACLAAMGCAAEGPLPAGVQAVVADALWQQQVVEAELEDQDGQTWWFAAVHPLGERYVNLYGRNVTERKRAEEAVQRTAEELARSNRELEQFAYVASHDLQEPLRVVGGYLQLIERRYRDRIDADANDFINFAVDGAARMQQLISDLLDYSRVGTQGKPFAPTDLEAVLDKAVSHLQAAVDESGAVVTHDPLPTIEADELQWVRLLQNLIGNAIKYRGPRRPEIHVSARHDGGRWVFSVRDNGIGVEPQYWERIFAIFQRLHTRRKYPGTGIGLAICKRIVERHGGRIWLESQPGQGTTFFWTLGK